MLSALGFPCKWSVSCVYWQFMIIFCVLYAGKKGSCCGLISKCDDDVVWQKRADVELWIAMKSRYVYSLWSRLGVERTRYADTVLPGVLWKR